MTKESSIILSAEQVELLKIAQGQDENARNDNRGVLPGLSINVNRLGYMILESHGIRPSRFIGFRVEAPATGLKVHKIFYREEVVAESNVSRIKHGLPVSKEIAESLENLEEDLQASIRLAKDSGLPQGLLVALLQGYAQKETQTMMGG